MRTILFLLLLAAGAPLCAQSVLKGRITDAENNSPLCYAVVTTGSARRGVITDANGHFQISIPAAETSLTISLIGYRSQTLHWTPAIGNVQVKLIRGTIDLKMVTINPQSNQGSFHSLSAIDLHLRPVNSSQDLLRLVPGLFLGEHHGGGIAEHIFFRGFDADHGTDVNVSVDDMPVNLVSHAHGQGFADLHFVIPELVTAYEFGKGPYYAGKGDFTTAGFVDFHTADQLEKNIVKIEGGQFNSGRIMTALNLLGAKAKEREESAYISGEFAYTDGPFDFPQHFPRINLFGKYNTKLGTGEKLTITASTFSSKWRSTGSIPERAVEDGQIGRFGYIDSLQGGNTSRTNFIAKLSSVLSDKLTMENQVYYTRYHFDHHYNDTYFSEDSVNGDQLKQHEDRDLAGYNGKLTHHVYLKKGADLSSAAGWGFQYNAVYNSELSHTTTSHEVLEYLQLGNIHETGANLWLDENLRSGRWLFNAGIRLDYFHFRYQDKVNAPLPDRGKAIVSPKINVEYTLSPALQFYIKTGKGFHSNDARVVTGNEGHYILPAAYGADVGVNWKPIDRLYINAAVWYLYLEQEFVYDGDEGTLEPSGKTGRRGLDFSARYQMTDWLFLVADVNWSRARDLAAGKGEDYIPLAVPLSGTGGLNVRLPGGWNGGLSYRYMKNRPANEDNSLIAKGYFVNDLTVYYTRKKYEAGLEIQNIFNSKWREEQFAVASRLRGEPEPVEAVNFTAGTSFFAKLKLAVFF